MVTRVLLDEHISGRVVGAALRSDGHDVLAADTDPLLAGMSDRDVLLFAARERRVVVSANGRDFLVLAHEFASHGRHHAGMILIPGRVRTDEFGALIAGVRQVLADQPASTWVDAIVWLPPRQ